MREYYDANWEAICDKSKQRYWALEGFAYTRRRHQIDMARRPRKIRRNASASAARMVDERGDPGATDHPQSAGNR